MLLVLGFTAAMWQGIPILGGGFLFIFIIAVLAMWVDGRGNRRAREGGCICQRGNFVIHQRSDCPYCNP